MNTLVSTVIKTAALAAAAFVFSSLASANSGNEEAVLQVTRGDNASATQELVFSEADLLAFQQHSIVTDNDYVDSVTEFTGPRLVDVLDGMGLDRNGSIRAIAQNDYSVNIPISHLYDYDVILALRADGEAMNVREKGPIWIIYPTDDFAELQDPSYNAFMIWQVASVAVE